MTTASMHHLNGARAATLSQPALRAVTDAIDAMPAAFDSHTALLGEGDEFQSEQHLTSAESERGNASARKRAALRRADVGDLVDTDQDKMVLQTKEGLFLFAGRSYDAKNQVAGIVGGRRAAAASRAIWLLSGNDNPYADWGLISTSAALEAAGRAIEQACAAREQEIEACRRRGLSLSIQSSKVPAELEIGFRSPYGYAIAELVLHFDYFVRLVKTLVRKDRVSAAQGREQIVGVRRVCRAAFEVAVRFERYLAKPELRALSRSDFLPNADDAARQRVADAVQIYGEVPRDVFTGKLRPRHSRRRGRVSDQELRLLSELSLSAPPISEQSAAALL